MKKMKIAMACAAVAADPAALAQSVQMYGVVDMAVSAYRAEGAGTRTMVTSNGNQASRLGFRGREDLGNGLAAGFDTDAICAGRQTGQRVTAAVAGFDAAAETGGDIGGGDSGIGRGLAADRGAGGLREHCGRCPDQAARQCAAQQCALEPALMRTTLLFHGFTPPEGVGISGFEHSWSCCL